MCLLVHGQRKAALHARGSAHQEQRVLLMLKVNVLPVLCHDHDHGYIRILGGRNLNCLKSFLQEKEHEYSIRYGALEEALRINLLRYLPGKPTSGCD